MKVRILVVDTDLTACKQIKYTVQNEQTEVYYASSVQEALQFLAWNPFTVIILNVTLCQEPALMAAMARQRPEPLVILSCEVSTPIETGFTVPDLSSMLGKPYDLETGLKKAREIVRETGCRDPSTRSYILAHGSSLIIDLSQRVALLDGEPMELTQRNFELLCCMAESLGKIIRKEALVDEVWKFSYDVYAESALRFQINRLRQRFRELGHLDIIDTVWGVGYKLKAGE